MSDLQQFDIISESVVIMEGIIFYTLPITENAQRNLLDHVKL